MDNKQQDWHREMQVRFDADELSDFFDAFSPLESPFETLATTDNGSGE